MQRGNKCGAFRKTHLTVTMLKKNGNSRQKRLHGAGQRVHDLDVEEILFGWIMDLRACNLHVSSITCIYM